MKRIVILLILVSTTAFGQTQKKPAQSKKDIATANIKKWFKNDYVNKSFKDPYSYKLMKIELTTFTNGMKLYTKIKELKADDSPHMKEINNLLISKYEELIGRSPKTVLDTPEGFLVALDAYAKNGLGNLVLGRYRFLVDLKGNLVDEIIDINEN